MFGISLLDAYLVARRTLRSAAITWLALEEALLDRMAWGISVVGFSYLHISCSIDPDHPVTIEEWVALKERFRVVSNGTPKMWPSKKSSNAELREIYITQVKPLVPQILGQYGISFTVMDLEYWHERYNTSKGQETFLVETTYVTPATWPAAVSAIEELFVASGALDIVKQIQIEICNPTKMYRD